ncbi:hypothetical protein ACO0K3_07025 [Undibacterium sp. Rencai35W]|uniref:hypothetical protein n=1 Tax=Undibacterium sp. Rencai35W TaxID=3413046 RepID=UPI003BF1E356
MAKSQIHSASQLIVRCSKLVEDAFKLAAKDLPWFIIADSIDYRRSIFMLARLADHSTSLPASSASRIIGSTDAE